MISSKPMTDNTHHAALVQVLGDLERATRTLRKLVSDGAPEPPTGAVGREFRAIEKLSDSIVRRVRERPGISHGKLIRLVTAQSTRHRFEPALALALERGTITEREISGTSEPGRAYFS